MKTTTTLLVLFLLFSLNTFAQDYTQWGLPEGAKAALGKGRIEEIAYSPDGTRLAVASSIGIWIYDMNTYQEVALLTGHGDDASRDRQPQEDERFALLTGHTVSFSPDGSTIASTSRDGTCRLWDALTGTSIRTPRRAYGGCPKRSVQSRWGDPCQRECE